MFYQITSTEGHGAVTVFDSGEAYTATDEHPNFRAIVASLIEDDTDTSVLDLFDVARQAAAKLTRLTERVSVADGTVYFDGDRVDDSIAKAILRFAQQGVDDWKPLVAFMENVAANPNEHSRAQLYDWLVRYDFTITPEGHFIGYKGVQRDPEHGFVSIHRGPAVVDGVAVNGNVPNRIGAVVEIGRSVVHHDPSVGCSTGLHVGTFDYARSFGRGVVLECHVNPRDVVSVPTDCGWAKVRTCRYKVVDIIEVPYESALVGHDYDPDDFDYDDWDDDWLDAYERKTPAPVVNPDSPYGSW